MLGYQKSPRRVFPLTRLWGGIGSGVGTRLRGGAERSREGSRELRGPCAKRRRRPSLFLSLPFSPGPLPSPSVLTFSHPVRPPRPSLAGSLFFPFISPGYRAGSLDCIRSLLSPGSSGSSGSSLSLLLFLASRSHILGTAWCPQTPIWLCPYPESRLFLSHDPHPQLGTRFFLFTFSVPDSLAVLPLTAFLYLHS